MLSSDEKKAFEDMMAEIEDSDDEDSHAYISKTSNAKPAPKYAAESKRTDNHFGSSSSGAKQSSSFQPQPSYKMSKEDEEIERFGSEVNQSAAHMQSEQIAITKRWLMRTCSMNDRNTMKCFVERERSSFGMQTTYRCYVEGTGGSSSAGSVGGRTSPAIPASASSGAGATASAGVEAATASGARFLMSAKKRVVNKTSYYLISLDPDAVDDRGSEALLGKV